MDSNVSGLSGATFIGELREFQKLGVDFILKNDGNALLADEQGLGKSWESLAYLVRASDALPALIVAQVVNLENWRREILRLLSFDRPPSAHYDQHPEIPIIEMIRHGHPGFLPSADLYLINYELLAKRKDDLMSCGLKTIILDEAHNIRNLGTRKYRAAKDLSLASSIRHRLCTTGTPVYNYGAEIWPLADFIKPGMLGTHFQFAQLFCDKNDKRMIQQEKRPVLEHILRETIMIRRTKKDVLKELPDKTRLKQHLSVDVEFYEKEMEKVMAELGKKLGEARSDLRKITDAYRGFNASERQIAGIAKLPKVVEYIKSMMEIEESLVVFCHHRAVHDSLMTLLSRYDPVQIIGGQSDAERQESIDSFQARKTKLLIAGLRAGNVGITLTAAHYVCFAELDWSPACHKQSEDRLHRLGQKHPVFAYYLEGESTFDEVISAILLRKIEEMDQVIGDPPEIDSEEQTRLIVDAINKRLEAKGRHFDFGLPSKERILAERKLQRRPIQI